MQLSKMIKYLNIKLMKRENTDEEDKERFGDKGWLKIERWLDYLKCGKKKKEYK